MENAPQELSKRPPDDECEVVMSCRARMARNLAGFPFVNRASETQRREILNMVQRVLLGNSECEGMIWVDLLKSTDLDRRLLVERHLISRNHAESEIDRAVAVSEDEELCVMINEEDHLRIQVLAVGMALDEAFVRVNAIDDSIESQLDYAFHQRWGYLTACPTNVGTGIRFSVMMHLPALRITSEIERVRRAAKELHLAVRGYYGEGSESAGDFYQISNQVTLGRNEDELLAEFNENIIPRIIEYELQARRLLKERDSVVLNDRTNRALGVLCSARLLGAEEAMKLLSRVRLGIFTGTLGGLDINRINQLFLEVQPAHLQQRFGGKQPAEQLRERRATIVRQALGES